MKYDEAKNYSGNKVKLIVSNGFSYEGVVKEINADTLVLLDKFNNYVSIKLAEIVVCLK